MDSKDIDIINQIFKAQDWLTVAKEMTLSEELPILNGNIEIPTVKETVLMEVNISGDFPLRRIEFRCYQLKGYPHVMPGGLLCLTAAPAAKLEDRLLLELNKLKKWVEDYYVNERTDDRFEYYNFQLVQNTTLIFEEGVGKEPLNGTYGRFNYSQLNDLEFLEKNRKTWIAHELGGRKCRWSSTFLSACEKPFTGLWIYTQRPPLVQRRETITLWSDLLALMTADQTKFLNDEHKNLRNETAFKGGFLLMLGYDIPAANGTEIHWETIFISFDKFPFTSRKISPGLYGPLDLGYQVTWCKSYNASYERLFGRGQLSKMFTEKKVLIIGAGAIGSNLLEALVRGGCRFVDIRDGDFTEPGNICRAQFTFRDSFFPKVMELLLSAIRISPYLEIKQGGEVTPMRKDNSKYPDLKTQLSQYDLIFDCSTSKYVSIMLDEMNLPATIINFSITNEAKELCVITGTGNIHKIKNDLYNRLSPGKQERFFVATGCWSPSFRASFVDLNVLLMYAVKEINHRLEKNRMINSFYVQLKEEEDQVTYQLSYHV